VARGDIFPLNLAREPFFVKMWPAYETDINDEQINRRIFSSTTFQILKSSKIELPDVLYYYKKVQNLPNLYNLIIHLLPSMKQASKSELKLS